MIDNSDKIGKMMIICNKIRCGWVGFEGEANRAELRSESGVMTGDEPFYM